MSSRPSDLPTRLRGRAFRVADAPEVSRRRSRASDLWIPVRGARLPIDQQGPVSICHAIEGDHHRDRDQWRRDLARRRRLEALGWIYLPVTQADLSDPADLLADLRAAVTRRGREATSLRDFASIDR
ncbi:hypothetical protein M1D46_12675 [Microbacterium sp. JZ70]